MIGQVCFFKIGVTSDLADLAFQWKILVFSCDFENCIKNQIHFVVFAVLCVLVQMSSFLKQVDAAQKFLRGVKTLPTFASLEEEQVLRLEKIVDKVHNVTTAQAAAILDLLDETLWSDDACAKLKTLVAEMTAEAEASQAKRDTQDYRMLPHYMSSDLSEQLKAKQEKENVALQKLCKHAWLLGLRCPSELTFATLLCMAHYNSVSRMSDKDKYSFLLHKKPLLKKWLGALPKTSKKTASKTYLELRWLISDL